MISIIVCSVNHTLFEMFKKSVVQTIGVQYEIIKIDNLNKSYSICEAYNLGASKSNHEYLCFAHEDILFKSQNWGAILLKHFEQDSKIGVIGVAGSKYKSLSPSDWPSGSEDLDCINIIQHQKEHNESIRQINNPDNYNSIVEVQTLDGLFMLTRKSIWEKNKFDQQTFKGFHCYDLDFCLQIGKNCKVMVTYEVLIKHLSEGSHNKDWIMNSILLSQKWINYLPVGDLSYDKKKKLEWRQKKLFLQKMLIYGSTKLQTITVFIRFGYIKYFTIKGNVILFAEIFKSIMRKINYKLKPKN